MPQVPCLTKTMPFGGYASVCGLPLFLYGLVTVMVLAAPLKRIVVLPVNT